MSHETIDDMIATAAYAMGFRAGAEATQAAACAMLERAQQPAAALGVSLMKLPEPPK